MEENNREIWVFLSHSNKDYEKVKEVRNILEHNSFRPIMFFLKCLADDDEIDALIKREIDSRERFILCNSENARNSQWVQKEIQYIKSRQRIIQTIDIDADIKDIEKAIRNFKKRNSVFISYCIGCKEDERIANILRLALEEKDFMVNMSKNFSRQDDLEDLKQYHASTYKIIENETLIILLSKNWGYHELKDIYSPMINSIDNSKSRIYICLLDDEWKPLINTSAHCSDSVNKKHTKQTPHHFKCFEFYSAKDINDALAKFVSEICYDIAQGNN